jgi:hypothetical protein
MAAVQRSFAGGHAVVWDDTVPLSTREPATSGNVLGSHDARDLNLFSDLLFGRTFKAMVN